MLTPTVAIECTKEGVKFSCQGDIGSGSVQLRQHTNVEKPGENVEIDLSEPVSLTFSLKYLVNFCKASGLSDTVKLSLSSEVPLLVEYGLSSNSYLRFYLAPKVSHPCTVTRFCMLTPPDWRRGVIVVIACVFRIYVGKQAAHCHGLHTERSSSFTYSGDGVGEWAAAESAGVPSSTGPPPWPHVIARGISDNGIQDISHLCTRPYFRACLIAKLEPARIERSWPPTTPPSPKPASWPLPVM